jgi:hypothetical protein
MDKAKALYLRQLKARLLKTEPAFDAATARDGLAEVLFNDRGQPCALYVVHEQSEVRNPAAHRELALLVCADMRAEKELAGIKDEFLRTSVAEFVAGLSQEEIDELREHYKASLARRPQ